MKTVVFDIGGVLVDWQPHLAWIDELGSRDARAVGMDAIHFTGAQALSEALETRGVL